MNRKHGKPQGGFTLIELAIVLVIVTILIGGLAVPLSAQIEARRIAETRKTMEEAREAIIGYAMKHTLQQLCTCAYQPDTTPDPASTCPVSHCPPTGSATLNLSLTRHYLPCPDVITDDGLEDRVTSGPTQGACASPYGRFPWVSLGTAAEDAWGNRLHYGITPDYGNDGIGFSNASTGDKRICSTSAGGCTSGTVAKDLPVVLVSYGPNGWGALNVSGSSLHVPTSADERENAPASYPNNAYVSRAPSKADAANGEFDDLLVWISSPLLISRVCPSGGCP